MTHISKNTNLHIGIVGYGRMGHEVAREAKKRGHTICCIISPNSTTHYESLSDIPEDKISHINIIIDFSLGNAIIKNVQWYSSHRIPAIIGATGWENDKSTVEDIILNHNSCILYAANFSIGAHIFAKVSEYIAQLIDVLPHYDIGIWENHHTKKKDRPSGTALMIAQRVLNKIKRKTHLISDIPNNAAIDDEALTVVSQRIGYERGFHELITNSDFDTIKLSHTARSRAGFALGAIMAAEWLYTKTDLYSGKLLSVDTWIDALLI